MPRSLRLLSLGALLLLGGCGSRQAAQVDLQIIYDEVGGYISPQNLQRIQQAAVDAGNQLGAPIDITRGHPIVLPVSAQQLVIAPQPGLPGVSWPVPPAATSASSVLSSPATTASPTK